MTGKERLWAAVSGSEPDRRPKIALFESLPESDARVAPWGAFGEHHMNLVAVRGPYARWHASGELAGSPKRLGVDDSNDLLGRATEAHEEILGALSGGADGIAYLLFGAHPEWCTPMEYGGLVLELDRELLSFACQGGFTLLWVAGGAGAYLDCVSDLPAHAFAWDAERTGIGAHALRGFHAGPCCAADDDADIELIGDLAAGGMITAAGGVSVRA